MIHKGDEPIPGYRIEGFLGQGAFGEVWQSSAPGGMRVALKFINLSGKNGIKEYQAIQRVKEIRHAHLLPIHAFWLLDKNGDPIDDDHLDAYQQRDSNAKFDGHEPSILVVAMMLADKSLADRLEECQQTKPEQGTPIDELLDHIEDAAKGIDFLNSSRHDLGEGPVALQHCDIKPQNILIVGNSAMVCDFGLARVLSDAHARTTGMAGSPAYMAPECIEAKQPSAATDQYSLAITYVELRTGQLPFDSDSYAAVLAAHLHGKVDLGRLSQPEQAVIRRAIATAPEDRFATSREMVRALRRAVEEGAVEETAGAQSISEQIVADSLPLLSQDTARPSPSPLDLGATLMPDDSNLPTTRAALMRETSPVEQSLIDSHPENASPHTVVTPLASKRLRTLAIAVVVVLFASLAWYTPSIIARFKSEPTASALQKPIRSPTSTPLQMEKNTKRETGQPIKPEEKRPVEELPAEKTPAEETPVQKPQSVELRFLPSDVQVFVDDSLQQTDGGRLTITGLMDQQVQIRVSKTGYEPYAQKQTLILWATQQDPVTLRPTIETVITLANEHAQAGRYRLAVEAFTQAIGRGDDSPEVYLARGKANVQLKNTLAALDDFATAIKLKSNFSIAYEGRADLLVLDRNTIEAAIEDYRNARKVSPEYEPRLSAKLAQALRIQGEDHQQNKRFSQAITSLEEAIRLSPELAADVKAVLSAANLGRDSQQADIYRRQGIAAVKAGNTKDAIGLLTKSIKLAATADALAARGFAYNAASDHDRAITDLTGAIRLNPNRAIYYTNRAYAHNAKKRFREALADLNRSLELDDRNPITLSNRGYAHRMLGNHNEAIADYQRSLKHKPQSNAAAKSGLSASYQKRAESLLRKNDPTQAISDFRAAIRHWPQQAVTVYPKLAQAYLVRGRTRARSGKLDLAIADCNQAIKILPTDAEAYRLRATAYTKRNNKGDSSRAAADYARVKQLGPN